MAERRNTRQRQLVLEVVQGRSDHPTAEQIYDAVHRVDAHVSRATVYRNLHLLADEGQILAIKAPGQEHFDLRVGSHPHIVCTQCGAVADVHIGQTDELDEEVRGETGWSVYPHAMIFEGLCPTCATKAAARAS